MLNANVRAECEDCNTCPPEYCIKNDTKANIVYFGSNFYIEPKCIKNTNGSSFKLSLNRDSSGNRTGLSYAFYPKLKYKKSLLKSVNYLLSYYKELEFEDCIKLTEIKQKCIIHDSKKD